MIVRFVDHLPISVVKRDHKSVEFTLLRTGGITFRTEIPLWGEYKANGRGHHEG